MLPTGSAPDKARARLSLVRLLTAGAVALAGSYLTLEPDSAVRTMGHEARLTLATMDSVMVASYDRARGHGAPFAESGPWRDVPDTLLSNMSIPDKVGQLFLAGFEGSDTSGALPAISELRVGGLVFLANATTAWDARNLTAALRQMAQGEDLLPPLIAIDHEGGQIQRLQGGMTWFGPNWQLGQVQPIETAVALACARGSTHGRELASVGINMNLAPVLDIWDNPQNTVIGQRSYSDDPLIVARLGAAYIEAMQVQGVLAVGKHFPGHGSSTEDSHLTLPVVRHDRPWLETRELVPFRTAVEAGVAGIMTAHVSYPLVDSVVDRPGTLSPDIVSGLLRSDLGYDGLVLTDDMGAMQAVTGRYEAGDAAVRAILAGADMLIVVGPLWRQRRMVQVVTSEVGNSITLERLDASARRILRAKAQAGLLGMSRPEPGTTALACASS
jgi:beta-N-acetylhexosaminidase